MSNLPLSTSFTGDNITEADFKLAMTSLRDYLNGLLSSSGLPADARTALQAQQLNSTLTSIANLSTAANKLPYFTAVDTVALTDITSAGRALLDDVDAAAQRATLGVAKSGVNSDITSLTGLTIPLSRAQGGSGVSTAAVEIQELLDAISTTQGTLLYRGATSWSSLAPGTAGQVLKTGGAGANPSWSTPSSIIAGTILTKDPLVFNTTTSQAHGLGQEPSFIRVVLECISAENEWVAGDRIDISAGFMADSNAASYYDAMVYSDTTNVYLKLHNGIYLYYKTSSAGALITASKWKIYCYPYKFA